jgi:hypothetical protein
VRDLAQSTLPAHPVVAAFLLLACHDPERENAEIAAKLRNLYTHPLTVLFAALVVLFDRSTVAQADAVDRLFEVLSHPEQLVRKMAADALAAAARELVADVSTYLNRLFDLYRKNLPADPAKDQGVLTRRFVASCLSADYSIRYFFFYFFVWTLRLFV